MKKILAFTLAETLIVMGVIGIVSALTLPNLNSSTGEKEKIVKVKKIYQNLTDAFGRAQAVYGPIDEWKTLDANVGAQITRFGERISEFMKVSKTCGIQTNMGCFSNKNLKYVDGTSIGSSYEQNTSYKFVLADGTAIIIMPLGIISVDIDGPIKGQNQVGTDIFTFLYDEKGNVSPYGPGSGGFSEYLQGSFSIMKNGYMASSWIINYDNMDYLKLTSAGKCPNGTTPTEQNPRCK